MSVYIYIYIERERYICIMICISISLIYIYICIERERERERERYNGARPALDASRGGERTPFGGHPFDIGTVRRKTSMAPPRKDGRTNQEGQRF